MGQVDCTGAWWCCGGGVTVAAPPVCVGYGTYVWLLLFPATLAPVAPPPHTYIQSHIFPAPALASTHPHATHCAPS